MKNLPFMHPSETELLDKICKLGSYYRKFQSFIDEYSFDMSSVKKILMKEGEQHKLFSFINFLFMHVFRGGPEPFLMRTHFLPGSKQCISHSFPTHVTFPLTTDPSPPPPLSDLLMHVILCLLCLKL